MDFVTNDNGRTSRNNGPGISETKGSDSGKRLRDDYTG